MLERAIRFKSFDGVELEGTFTSPKHGAFAQLVVLTPGIDVDREEEGFYTILAQHLADKGVASFRFDWRCHGYDCDRTLTELTLAGLHNDIDAAFHTAAKSSNRSVPITLLAQSFSGGVAANWSRRNAAMVSRTILLAPILDYVHEYLSIQGLGTKDGLTAAAVLELSQNGSLLSCRKTFSQQIINEFQAVEITLPENCWIIHGDHDSGVDIAVPKKFVSAFSGVRLLLVEGADHGFAEPGDEDMTSTETMAHYKLVCDEVSTLVTMGDITGVLEEWREL